MRKNRRRQVRVSYRISALFHIHDGYTCAEINIQNASSDYTNNINMLVEEAVIGLYGVSHSSQIWTRYRQLTTPS